jgi:hypothetical protein
MLASMSPCIGLLPRLVALCVLAAACGAPVATHPQASPLTTSSALGPTASPTEDGAEGFQLEFHVPRQPLLDRLTGDGYLCGGGDTAGRTIVPCSSAGGEAGRGIIIEGSADDLGAITLTTDDRGELTRFLAYARTEIDEWVQAKLSSVPDASGIDVCKPFVPEMVRLRVNSSGEPGSMLVVSLSIGAVEWPSMTCDQPSMDAGPHEISLFGLPVRFTIDEGWSATNVLWMMALLRDHGALRIERYGGEVIADRCTTPVTRRLRPTNNELVVWLAAYPGLEVEERDAVVVGGFPARVLDVKARGIPKCPNEKNPLATLWVPNTTYPGVDPAEGAESLADGEMMRIILVEHPDAVLILSIVAGDRTSPDGLQHMIDLSEPVIRSITFSD